MSSKLLQTVRKKIDSIDKKLQDLINQRAKLALEVGKIKQKDSNKVIYRPEREAQILQQIIKRNKGPLSAKDIAEIFLQIMGKCRALQKPIKIALSGNKKAAIYQATKKHFDGGIKIINQTSIANVFAAVNKNKSDYGIVPIESLIKGASLETVRGFLDAPLTICGEIYSRAERFLIIGNQIIKKSGHDKTALLIFSDQDFGCSLDEVKRNQGKFLTLISLCSIKATSDSKYVYFLEIDGYKNNIAIKRLLQTLPQDNIKFTSLGSYPKALI